MYIGGGGKLIRNPRTGEKVELKQPQIGFFYFKESIFKGAVLQFHVAEALTWSHWLIEAYYKSFIAF